MNVGAAEGGLEGPNAGALGRDGSRLHEAGSGRARRNGGAPGGAVPPAVESVGVGGVSGAIHPAFVGRGVRVGAGGSHHGGEQEAPHDVEEFESFRVTKVSHPLAHYKTTKRRIPLIKLA